MANKTQIRNPRRLLILSPASHSLSLIPSLLHTLTGHPIETPPVTPTQTFAGYTTHPPLRIENKYYTAEVPIWVDEIPLSSTTGDTGLQSKGKSLEEGEKAEKEENENEKKNGEDKEAAATASQWEKEFSSSEAQVVRDAIGAVIICIRNPEDLRAPVPLDSGPEIKQADDRQDVRELKGFIRAIGSVRALIEEERGQVGDVPGLLVLGVRGENSQKSLESESRGVVDEKGGDGFAELSGEEGLDDPFSIGWWEDQLFEMGLMGFEVVRWDFTDKEKGEEDMRRNQYGELQGMRRVKEVLETHEWTGDDGADTSMPEDDDLERELLGLDDEEGDGFALEVNELEREMVGLRMSIERGGDMEDDEGDEELQVDAVEALMMRMRAIKDMSDELPANERKRFAAKAVRDIMEEI
ncbi:hypothetical protein AOCH_007182 [Aspergillus ochraceoroseus]|uniref:Alpha and gamma adaptin binding protein p34 n=1 Tax=Aspergillus ochraceoroseus TaxID=138278 RepID=A0A0F8UBU0_9EURO|nr:hypothetical protein AOCH_007182 [Aspergillus ochraceoroseus]